MFFKKSSLVEQGPAALAVDALLLPDSVPVALSPLVDTMVEVLHEFDPAALDFDVSRAKLADVCRDLNLSPLDPLEMDSLTAGFDRGAIERSSLIVLVLEREAIARDSLRRIFDKRLRTAVKGGIVEPARVSSLVTLELLAQSSLRREELARRVILGLGASVAGESMAEARAALERLDYGRLIEESKRARQVLKDQGRA